MARYSDGRNATAEIVALDADADGLMFNAERVAWTALARADDGGGDIVLKRNADNGERITLDLAEVETAHAFAPALMSKKALPREGARLLITLMAIAGAVAALFLIVVPLEAEPMSRAMPQRYREHLADIAWRQLGAMSENCSSSDPGWRELNGMFAQLRRNMVGTNHAKLEVVETDLPNAFTLPDDTIVLTTGMIEFADTPDEIAGVLAHELGHVQARHVLPGVIRQMGLGLFIDVVFGGSGAGQVAAAINILSLRFSREDEAEADQIAFRLMNYAGHDPGALASLFRRLGEKEGAGTLISELISSHPDSGARAAEAAKHARPGLPPSLNAEDWETVRGFCRSDDDDEDED